MKATDGTPDSNKNLDAGLSMRLIFFHSRRRRQLIPAYPNTDIFVSSALIHACLPAGTIYLFSFEYVFTKILHLSFSLSCSLILCSTPDFQIIPSTLVARKCSNEKTPKKRVEIAG